MTYQTEVLADSPTLYWRYKETSGTAAADTSTGSHAGTYTNGPTLNQTSSPITNEAAARSILLDGVNDYVSSTYNPFSGQKTYEGWANRRVSGVRHCLFGDSNQGVMFAINSANTDVIFWTDTSSVPVSWTTAWPGNTQWVHWALEHDASAREARLRINGIDKGLKTNTLAYSSPGNFLSGARGGPNDMFDGNMTEIAIYSGLLGDIRTNAHLAAATAGTAGPTRTFWTRS